MRSQTWKLQQKQQQDRPLLKVHTLGGLSVLKGEEPVPLPASKITRSLLAYLVLTARPQRRDRLCEIFWELPDDPRGALRWSLSKLRRVVNDEEERLRADRERVELLTDRMEVDLHRIRAGLSAADCPREKLETFAAALAEPLLPGLDLPDRDPFQFWLVAERAEKDRLERQVRERLDAGSSAASPMGLSERALLDRQEIRFCTTADEVTIAHATVGQGPPLVKAANWLNHLELDWDAPIWSPLFRELARDYRFIRYDERGNGLSDWDVADINFETFVTDLETVVDALGVERFALLGISQGASVSIEYAVRHPDRVSHLILFGGYAAGWRIDASEATLKEREAVMTLTATGWGRDNPAYRQIFSSTFMPHATAEELEWFDEFQRRTTSPENAVRFLSAFGDIDVRDRLGQVETPTLVIHSRGDQRIPLSTGRSLAAQIPDAQFVSLDSRGHLLLGREPASQQFVNAVRGFLAK